VSDSPPIFDVTRTFPEFMRSGAATVENCWQYRASPVLSCRPRGAPEQRVALASGALRHDPRPRRVSTAFCLPSSPHAAAAVDLLRPTPARQCPAGIGGEHPGQQQPRQPCEYGGVPEPRGTALAHDLALCPSAQASLVRQYSTRYGPSLSHTRAMRPSGQSAPHIPKPRRT
jgi:hypothetical protein